MRSGDRKASGNADGFCRRGHFRSKELQHSGVGIGVPGPKESFIYETKDLL